MRWQWRSGRTIVWPLWLCALSLHTYALTDCSQALQNNQIGPHGAYALSEALLRNRALVELEVDGANQIEDAGASALLAALEQIAAERPRRSRLRSLQIQVNPLGRELVKCLKHAATAVRVGMGVNAGNELLFGCRLASL